MGEADLGFRIKVARVSPLPTKVPEGFYEVTGLRTPTELEMAADDVDTHDPEYEENAELSGVITQQDEVVLFVPYRAHPRAVARALHEIADELDQYETFGPPTPENEDGGRRREA